MPVRSTSLAEDEAAYPAYPFLELIRELPEGEIRNKFFDETSAFDSIADVMRQALDSLKSE